MFRGSGVAIITPFTENNEVNYEKLTELLEWQLKEGTDAIIACGTTGEAPTLSDIEHKAVIKHCVEVVKGRVPVIAGTGSNDTAYAIHMSQYAENAGADGLLVVAPYYNKPTQRGIIANFEAVADSVNIPIILYNVEGRTGVNIEPSTVEYLSKNPKIIGIKEASGNISQVVEIARVVPEDFFIWSGNDDMIVPMMSMRGDGVISVIANIAPKDTHDLVQLFIDGKIKESADLQLSMKPLIDALFCESNPIPVKTALNLMKLEVGPLRLPLVEMADDTLKRLETELKNYNLL